MIRIYRLMNLINGLSPEQEYPSPRNPFLHLQPNSSGCGPLIPSLEGRIGRSIRRHSAFSSQTFGFSEQGTAGRHSIPSPSNPC